MKKNILTILLIIFIILILSLTVSCQGNEEYDIVCTIFPQYDFCKKIVGDSLTVKMLLPYGTDAHNYNMTTKDKYAIQKSDIFIYIGGESEKWVKDVINSTNMTNTVMLNLSQYVELLPSNVVHTHDEEHVDGEHNENAFDEHIYLSIKNSIKFCRIIYEKLSMIYPEKENVFKQNTTAYISELTHLDSLYSKKVNEFKNKTMFFADRFPFLYLANDYGLDYKTPYHGCSTDIDISIEDKIEFENEYKKSNCGGIFVLESGNEVLAKNIVSEYGGKILRLHSCQSITKTEATSNKGYIEIMNHNLSVIEEGLK